MARNPYRLNGQRTMLTKHSSSLIKLMRHPAFQTGALMTLLIVWMYGVLFLHWVK
jgi:hypothetical protein